MKSANFIYIKIMEHKPCVVEYIFAPRIAVLLPYQDNSLLCEMIDFRRVRRLCIKVFFCNYFNQLLSKFHFVKIACGKIMGRSNGTNAHQCRMKPRLRGTNYNPQLTLF